MVSGLICFPSSFLWCAVRGEGGGGRGEGGGREGWRDGRRYGGREGGMERETEREREIDGGREGRANELLMTSSTCTRRYTPAVALIVSTCSTQGQNYLILAH